jgi:hypothetical protein
MAVDLVCYSSLPVSDCDAKLNELRGKRGDLFAKSFLVYSPRSADEVHIEIAREHTLERCVSTFLVSLNEKQHAGRIREVVELLKDQLGESRVLVLLNNEVPQ